MSFSFLRSEMKLPDERPPPGPGRRMTGGDSSLLTRRGYPPGTDVGKLFLDIVGDARPFYPSTPLRGVPLPIPDGEDDQSASSVSTSSQLGSALARLRRKVQTSWVGMASLRVPA